MDILTKILITSILSVLGAILYRMGGAAKTGKWYDFALNTKARDAGVPACTIAALIVCAGFQLSLWWAYLLSYGLLFGAMTTYWKKKGTDAKWYHWVFVGLGYSLAMLPFAWGDGSWLAFGLRTAALTAGIAVWSQLIGNAVLEELGRGFLTVLTVLLFLRKAKKK